MLKKRIVAKIVVRNGLVVQSINFNRYLPVGSPAIAVEFLNDWGVDEIILLDITASKAAKSPDYSLLREASLRCRVPLTFGGGIRCTDDILELMQCGADKISLNQVALHNPLFIEEATKMFGSQCIVASIDAIKIDTNYQVYDYLHRKVCNISVSDYARQLQDLGVGEILINSVDRDGAQSGFDTDLINTVCSNVNIPVICSGGAGKPQHFIEVIETTQVSGVAAANYFHFTEHSVTTTKAIVCKHNELRHETYAKYASNLFDKLGRLLKKDDSMLEELLYQQIEKEII